MSDKDQIKELLEFVRTLNQMVKNLATTIISLENRVRELESGKSSPFQYY